MTRKLYDLDSHRRDFSATVLRCDPDGARYAVVLDQTVFFPEGGGQPADTGVLGGARVLDVQLLPDAIVHYTDAPLAPSAQVRGQIDWPQRFRRMQSHSGEHIISGLIHKEYGFDNVGFHLGEDAITMDYSGELTWTQLMHIEQLANEAVYRNVPIRTEYPAPEQLAHMEYRSKLDLKEDIRIVTVEGYDVCACCAPHVAHTGEIGVIKIFTAERHRGGVRVTLLCGMDALDDYRRRQDSAAEISQLLSVPRGEIAPAVRRILDEQARLKERFAETSRELVTARAAAQSFTDGNICVFDSTLDDIALRELVNLLMEKCTGFAAAFSGSDEAGYKYIIGSRHIDLRKAARDINAAIGGRGGGRPEMIQGSTSETKEIIQKFVENVHV